MDTTDIGAVRRPVSVCQEAIDVLKASKTEVNEALEAIKDLDPAAQVVAAYREVQKRQGPPPPKAPKIAPVIDDDTVRYLAEMLLYATNDWDRLAAALYQVSTSEIREIVLEAIAENEANYGA